jgi:hypothetical protein
MRLANEVTTRDFLAKEQEGRLAELTAERDAVKKVASERKRELEALRVEVAKKETATRKAAADGLGVGVLKREVLELEARVAEAEAQAHKWMGEVEK